MMKVLLMLSFFSTQVRADDYADYDKYSQGIVEHAGVAARHYNAGNPAAVSVPWCQTKI